MNIKINTKYLYFIYVLIALSFFTASFDIFGVVNIAGFNMRLTQLFLLPVILGWIVNITFYEKEFVIPKKISFLLIWVLFQFLFIFRSLNFKNALGYFLWLLFDILVIFSISFYINTEEKFKWLIKVYMSSFVFMALIGLIQFFLFPLGISFYVTQNWNANLARINGFSYEPSYYATYLLVGFVIFGYLLIKREKSIFKYKNLLASFICISLALLLTSSRMGWLMSALFILLAFCILIKDIAVKHKNSRFNYILLGTGTFIVIVFFVAIVVLVNKIDLSFLLAGLGVVKGSSYSADDRINGLRVCIELFLNNPFLGVSLGGVDPAIANYYGIEYSTLDNGRAMSIVGEMLVSSGIFGTAAFLTFICELLFSKKHMKIQYALSVALLFEIAILCFNQNILRPYVWMLMTVIITGYNIKFNKNISVEAIK